MEHLPEDLEDVFAYNTDIYHANVSIFQSLPDVWAIDQLFPIMPIHRLNEAPERQGYLSDITCDCDGRIDRFADAHQVQSTLPLHELTDAPYYLGVFLVGAYQETLGDLHNLLGDTHVVSVNLNEAGELELSREVTGDSVEEVLSYVEYQPSDLMERIRNKAERAVREGRIQPNQRKEMLNSCRELLAGYTYCDR
jgi:arginine decarboxylase